MNFGGFNRGGESAKVRITDKISKSAANSTSSTLIKSPLPEEKSKAASRKAKSAKEGRKGHITIDDNDMDDDDKSQESGGGKDGPNENSDDIAVTPQSQFDDIIELLSSKRSTDRIENLCLMSENLSHNYLFDLIANREETFKLHLLNSLKKSTDDDEVHWVTKCASLFTLTVGIQDHHGNQSMKTWVNNFTSVAMDIAKNITKSPASRSCCLRAVSFISFIFTTDSHDILQILNQFSDLFRPKSTIPPVVLEAVADGWGIIATGLSSKVLISKVMDKAVPLFLQGLQHENVAVRTTSGENIAMLFAARHSMFSEISESAGIHLSDNGDDDEEMEEEQKNENGVGSNQDGEDDVAMITPVAVDSSKPQLKSSHHYPIPTPASFLSSLSSSDNSTPIADDMVFMTSLLEILETLSNDSNRHRNRKERAEQRASFREILRAVEQGEESYDAITINKKKLEFTSWIHCRQLNAFRVLIGKGLQSHFAQNPLVAEIFDLGSEDIKAIDDGVDDKDSEKAAAKAMSKVRGKIQYLDKNKQRRKKAAMAEGDFE